VDQTSSASDYARGLSCWTHCCEHVSTLRRACTRCRYLDRSADAAAPAGRAASALAPAEVHNSRGRGLRPPAPKQAAGLPWTMVAGVAALGAGGMLAGCRVGELPQRHTGRGTVGGVW
jgi:hypothetical protein